MSELSRRAVLSTGGRAAVATLALGGVSVASGLPTSGNSNADATVLAAIERHRAAVACHNAVCHEEPDTDLPEYEGWHERDAAAGDEVFDAVWSLIDEPATVSGVAAMLAYVAADPDSFLLMLCDDENSEHGVHFGNHLLAWAAESLAQGSAS